METYAALITTFALFMIHRYWLLLSAAENTIDYYGYVIKVARRTILKYEKELVKVNKLNAELTEKFKDKSNGN